MLTCISTRTGRAELRLEEAELRGKTYYIAAGRQAVPSASLSPNLPPDVCIRPGYLMTPALPRSWPSKKQDHRDRARTAHCLDIRGPFRGRICLQTGDLRILSPIDPSSIRLSLSSLVARPRLGSARTFNASKYGSLSGLIDICLLRQQRIGLLYDSAI